MTMTINAYREMNQLTDILIVHNEKVHEYKCAEGVNVQSKLQMQCSNAWNIQRTAAHTQMYNKVVSIEYAKFQLRLKNFNDFQMSIATLVWQRTLQLVAVHFEYTVGTVLTTINIYLLQQQTWKCK